MWDYLLDVRGSLRCERLNDVTEAHLAVRVSLICESNTAVGDRLVGAAGVKHATIFH